MLAGSAQHFRSIQMFAGLLEDVRDNSALTGQTKTVLAELSRYRAAFLQMSCEDHFQLRTLRK